MIDGCHSEVFDELNVELDDMEQYQLWDEWYADMTKDAPELLGHKSCHQPDVVY